jgi:hypothetical protein
MPNWIRKATIMARQTAQERSTNVSTMPVVESNAKFRDGVCSGYLTYFDEYQSKPITDTDVYNFLIQNIMDVHGTDQFNAGYWTGWIEALIEDRWILYSTADRR